MLTLVDRLASLSIRSRVTILNSVRTQSTFGFHVATTQLRLANKVTTTSTFRARKSIVFSVVDARLIVILWSKCVSRMNLPNGKMKTMRLITLIGYRSIQPAFSLSVFRSK